MRFKTALLVMIAAALALSAVAFAKPGKPGVSGMMDFADNVA